MIQMSDLAALRGLEAHVTFEASVQARLADIHAEANGQPLSDEARSEFAALQEVEKETVKAVTELRERETYLASLTGSERNVERPYARPQIIKSRRVPENIFALDQYRNLSNSEAELGQAYRDGAMYAVERSIYPNPQSVAATEQAHIADLLATADLPGPANPRRELAQRIIATGSAEYLTAFTKYVQGRPLSPSEQHAVGAWTVQTDATGGYAVPFMLDPTILHTGAWTNVNPYRAACTVKTIVGSDTYQAPTTTNFTVARAAEAAAATEGLGAVGQFSAIVGKVHGVGTVSIELLQDRPDVVSEIASLISEAKDTEESSSFTVGVGDALGQGFNPIGMLPVHGTAGAYTHMDTISANGAVAAADAYAVESAVPIRHRTGAAWFMNRGVIRVFQALETTGGQLFGGQNYASVGYPVTSGVGNTGLTLLNYPIWETPDAPAFVAATDDLVIAALCQPKSFYIIERAGMSVEVIPHFLSAATGFPTGQRMIYAWWRNTAKPSNVDAGRRLALLA